MKFSVIVPSYNQDRFIERTFENLRSLKEKAPSHGCQVELLLFDSCSGPAVADIIRKYEHIFDKVEVKKDKGQYDAINKGIQALTGDYWTWLNTDDLIDEEGFFRMAALLGKEPGTDYIYGTIDVIDESGELIRSSVAPQLDLERLLNRDAGIWQPGSFFRKAFTDKIGLLAEYNCSFDYEYVLRLFKNHANIRVCDFRLAFFRMHSSSKSGSIVRQFVKEQSEISRRYGRRPLSYLSLLFFLRKIKHNIT